MSRKQALQRYIKMANLAWDRTIGWFNTHLTQAATGFG
jgi:hypothetical protein